MAWWEQWFPAKVIQDAFAKAALKLDGCKTSWWRSAAGPVTS